MSKFCSSCGHEVNMGADVCLNCGKRLTSVNNVNINTNVGPNIPDEYKPISMWGYFGYQLLFAIPLVGFILLLVFSFGGAKNINLRNFARSYFCFFLIGIFITIILILIPIILATLKA